MERKFKNAIFDLGGVLIDWNPRYLFRQVFNSETEMEDFLSHVCNDAWNLQQDAGRSFAEGTALLCEQFPHYAPFIRLYFERWSETLNGEIAESVTLLEKLKLNHINLYALTNWSHETFPYARQHFPCLTHFLGIVVSGEEKVIKPDQKIFEILFERYHLLPDESVFIDDKLENVKAAEKLGITGIHFISPMDLEKKLKQLGLL